MRLSFLYLCIILWPLGCCIYWSDEQKTQINMKNMSPKVKMKTFRTCWTSDYNGCVWNVYFCICLWVNCFGIKYAKWLRNNRKGEQRSEKSFYNMYTFTLPWLEKAALINIGVAFFHALSLSFDDLCLLMLITKIKPIGIFFPVSVQIKEVNKI